MAEPPQPLSSASRLRVNSSADREPYTDHKDFDRASYRSKEADRYRDRDKNRDNRDNNRDKPSSRAWHADIASKAAPPPPPLPIASDKTRLSEKSRAPERVRESASLSPNSDQDHHSSEKEPGEISSGSMPDDSGAVVGERSTKPDAASAKNGTGTVTSIEKEGNNTSPVPKKRKFTPIVWDLDDKQPQRGSSGSFSVTTTTNSTAFSKSSASSKPQSRVLASTATVSPAGMSSSPPLPPPPPLPYTPKLRESQHQHHHRTPPGNAQRETYQKNLTRQSSTPPKASLSRNPNVTGKSPSTGSGSGAVPSRGGISVDSQNPSLPSPEQNADATQSTEFQTERTRPDGQVASAPKCSPGETFHRELSGSPHENDVHMQPAPPSIAGSRWAEETTPLSENKIPLGMGKSRIQHSPESVDGGHLSANEEGGRDGGHQSISPEPGEYIRDKPEPGDTGGSNMGKDYDAPLDDQYERDLNNRELMDIDKDSYSESEEEERPEVESEDDEPPAPAAPPLRAIDMLQGCRNVDEFERLNKIDEGTYGVVYRARDKKTGEIVALKKVKMEKEREGFPMTSLREINVLLSIHHPSIVDVKEVVVGSNLDSIFMVMEYMEHDLKGLMETIKQPFSQSEVKCLMLQLFEGVKHLHDNWVLHRDLKTSNLLLNNRGELKICDFGLARQYGSPLKTYTHMVVTLWYRAPELLLGCKQYSTAVDMWSLGCIMAEFLAKEPLFNGKNELDQLDKIFKILGTPNETIWPDFPKLRGVKCNFVKQPYNRLREKFPPTAFAAGRPTLSENGFNLLNRLLLYDPKKRITAEEALNHEWFREVPLPKMKELMPTYPARSEHERRSRRLMKSPDPLIEQRKKELRQAELGSGGLFG